jgi:2Fe-2S ferredoxin
MAKIIIVNDNLTIELPDGSYVKEYLKEKSSLMFGCEKGQCGMCICSVLKGIENLEKPSQSESDLLIRRRANPNQRLTCQLKIIKGEAVIEY